MTSEIGRPHAAIPCITDGVDVTKVLTLLDQALGSCATMRWGVRAQQRTHDVAVALDSYGITIAHRRRLGSVRRPWLRLEPAGEELVHEHPSDLIRSWQQSLEIAVEAKSVEASPFADRQAHAARLLVAAGEAAGEVDDCKTFDVMVRSRRALKESSRFTMNTKAVGTVFPGPKLDSFLAAVSPPYRRLVLKGTVMTTTIPHCEFCSFDEVGPMEMMRLVAELPEPAVQELRLELSHREVAGIGDLRRKF